VIATHDLDLALELCDRTVVLNRGQVVGEGETAKILSNREFLEQHDLEIPLCYSRPYCAIADAPSQVSDQ
jgi:cobalt/nickel transport system ATP-binding protein